MLQNILQILDKKLLRSLFKPFGLSLIAYFRQNDVKLHNENSHSKIICSQTLLVLAPLQDKFGFAIKLEPCTDKY